MEFTTCLDNFDEDSIEPCRTCGIYYTMGLNMDQAMVKPIFGRDNASKEYLGEIIEQMGAWNLKVERDDGRPQYMCISCIAEFQKLLKFKQSCLETQDQFGDLEAQRGVVIKKEIDADPEEQFCGFIYLDTDDEDISDEDGSRRVCAAFDIPHVPIKEEHMARVPTQNESVFQSPEPKTLGSPLRSSFDMMDVEELTGGMFVTSSEDASATADENDDEDEEEDEEEEEIFKFTYDDEGETQAPLPLPVQSPVVYCKMCSHESPSQEEHLNHMRRTHLLKDWECHICGKKITNAPESRLKFHMKWHKLANHLKCAICGFLCNSKDTLKEHKLAVHTRTKCSYCRKTVKQSLLQEHMNKHLEEREAELAQHVQQNTKIQTNASIGRQKPSSNKTISDGSEKSELRNKLPPETPSNLVTTSDRVVSSASVKPTFQAPSPPMREPPSMSILTLDEPFNQSLELEAHVLASHKTPQKRKRSLENAPRTTRYKSQAQSLSLPMELKQTSIAEPENSKLEEPKSPRNASPKSYTSCHICGKEFDLKIKLNRHLKTHKI
ncbi:uncharacterized protein Dana_GF18438 [Drosophila ananassae]|uniref:C2H2-type domain-containing protein n=1 Tax=Drosophila ananassae TaxID=7217 RepID=B3M211_DROAN|nr:zinc finger protein 845 [Drosophila ananassae]EDV43335.1 uncharacterized protein Dana_GF18438 [Drosophila ananassae]